MIEAIPANTGTGGAMDVASAGNTVRRIACVRCGTAFECGAGSEAGCWCMDEAYRLPMPNAADGDCLCRACLRGKAVAHSTGPAA